jgi:hypothetical protein
VSTRVALAAPARFERRPLPPQGSDRRRRQCETANAVAGALVIGLRALLASRLERLHVEGVAATITCPMRSSRVRGFLGCARVVRRLRFDMVRTSRVSDRDGVADQPVRPSEEADLPKCPDLLALSQPVPVLLGFALPLRAALRLLWRKRRNVRGTNRAPFGSRALQNGLIEPMRPAQFERAASASAGRS